MTISWRPYSQRGSLSSNFCKCFLQLGIQTIQAALHYVPQIQKYLIQIHYMNNPKRGCYLCWGRKQSRSHVYKSHKICHIWISDCPFGLDHHMCVIVFVTLFCLWPCKWQIVLFERVNKRGIVSHHFSLCFPIHKDSLNFERTPIGN